MASRARRLPAGLALVFVAAIEGSLSTQSTGTRDDLDTLIREAQFAAAESAARARLGELERTAGPDSIDVARVLDTLVEALWRGGKVRLPETTALAERSIAIKEAWLGPDHADVAFSVTTLGVIHRLLGDYPASTALFERALAIQERALGPMHLDVARTQTMFGTLATDTGDLQAAQSLHEGALAIRQRALPSGDASVAENYNGLGVILERRGDDRGALKYHAQALAIREQALGATHPDVASSLNNLGNVHLSLGEYATARSMHERALAIRERALGPNHPDVAMSLNNLSIAVRDLGDHAAAWWHLERVLGIYETVFGAAHPNVAIVSHNLATIMIDLDQAAANRLLAERARRARSGTSEASGLTESLNSLVGVNPPSGNYEAARALLERALAIKEKVLGPDHTSVALTLSTLAGVHRKLEQREKVRPLYERAYAIWAKARGPAHPDAADTLDRLGEFLAEGGEYDAARDTYTRALSAVENMRGPDHPNVGVLRQHLAEALMMLGADAAALKMAIEAERVGRDHFRLIGRTLPEREALMYAAMRPTGSDVALTLAARAALAPGDRQAVWDAIIRSRAVVLDEIASRHRASTTADDQELDRLFSELGNRREQLARLVVSGPGGPGTEYRVELQRARDARDAAERALAERSVDARHEQLQRRIGYDEVTASLPQRSALVAFVRYLQHPARTPAGLSPAASSPVAAYLAFVMRAGSSGEPAIVALGAASDIEDAIAGWRKQMIAPAFAGGRAIGRAEIAIRGSGRTLRAKIWDPLVTVLDGAERIFIVPDGALHLVNWAALPADRSGYLIEHAPPLHYLSAERDLLPFAGAATGRGLLVVDSPVFNDRPGARADAAQFRGLRSGCADFQSMRFDPLPASAREADTIVRIWKQSLAEGGELRLTGRGATEAAVKQRAARTRVLHLATHGFFLGGRCASALPQAAGSHDGGASSLTGPAESPLLLSGFALTGANQRQKAAADAEDGILTAEEIAALDLRGVEWAVLSACDTGVGEVRAGEGVLGLRRAFQIAGARTVIMSLWPVGDEDTRRWMTSVYEARFTRTIATMDAAREATLEQLRRRRQAALSTHPFYWGGFIAAGDWR